MPLILEAATDLVDQGAEMLITGCTEVPLGLDVNASPVGLIDPTTVLAAAVLRRVGANTPPRRLTHTQCWWSGSSRVLSPASGAAGLRSRSPRVVPFRNDHGAIGAARMDDPEHAVVRRMLTKDFTVKRVNGLRPQIETTANDFIDTMIEHGSPADLTSRSAAPSPCR